MRSIFGEILRQTVSSTPGAVGGALAAGDGETVDFWTSYDDDDWCLLTAHFGVVVNHIRSAMHTFHFGDIEFVHLSYADLELAIQIIDRDYYVLLALTPPARLGAAKKNLQTAAASLRKEMR